MFVPGRPAFHWRRSWRAGCDGEVCQTAIETALSGTFEIILRKNMTLTRPRAETPTHLITMAFDVDLDDAAQDAVREMIKLLWERKALSAADAYSLMSLACDLRVTQLVNGNKGVHAMMANGAPGISDLFGHARKRAQRRRQPEIRSGRRRPRRQRRAVVRLARRHAGSQPSARQAR